MKVAIVFAHVIYSVLLNFYVPISRTTLKYQATAMLYSTFYFEMLTPINLIKWPGLLKALRQSTHRAIIYPPSSYSLVLVHQHTALHQHLWLQKTCLIYTCLHNFGIFLTVFQTVFGNAKLLKFARCRNIVWILYLSGLLFNKICESGCKYKENIYLIKKGYVL